MPAADPISPNARPISIGDDMPRASMRFRPKIKRLSLVKRKADGSGCFPHKTARTSFVAQIPTPAAGCDHPARGVARDRNRTGAADNGNAARLACRRQQQFGVVENEHGAGQAPGKPCLQRKPILVAVAAMRADNRDLRCRSGHCDKQRNEGLRIRIMIDASAPFGCVDGSFANRLAIHLGDKLRFGSANINSSNHASQSIC